MHAVCFLGDSLGIELLRCMLSVCLTLLETTAEYTFFSSSHGMVTKIEYILDHKTHFNKDKIIEIVQHLLSDYDGIKLKITERYLENPKIHGD